MNIQLVKNLMFKNRLSQADLARMGHVSRAAVTKWFHQAEKTGWANVQTDTLVHLSESLQVQPGLLLTKPIDWSQSQTRFLWDHLYPDMESFTAAISTGRAEALARLVQVLGFSESLKIAGKKVVLRFDNYKRIIKPARRKELEILWPLYASQI